MASVMMTQRERFKCKHTMVCLLQALVGRITAVELRNECCATGRIDCVDGFMNVTMSKVLFVDQEDKKMHMESFFLQGSLIRYIQIPDDIDMVDAMKKQLLTLNRRRQLPGSMTGRKLRDPLRLGNEGE